MTTSRTQRGLSDRSATSDAADDSPTDKSNLSEAGIRDTDPVKDAVRHRAPVETGLPYSECVTSAMLPPTEIPIKCVLGCETVWEACNECCEDEYGRKDRRRASCMKRCERVREWCACSWCGVCD